MRIINQSKNCILAEEAVIAESFFRRCKGLLGKKALPTGQALVLRPCNSVHTFFMRFPIDVAFIGKDNKVVKIIPSIPPFRLTPIYFKAHFAIEFPAGTLGAANLKEQDEIELIC
jgi:uncharacterized membrane protein (UPF0127 family)